MLCTWVVLDGASHGVVCSSDDVVIARFKYIISLKPKPITTHHYFTSENLAVHILSRWQHVGPGSLGKLAPGCQVEDPIGLHD